MNGRARDQQTVAGKRGGLETNNKTKYGERERARERHRETDIARKREVNRDGIEERTR